MGAEARCAEVRELAPELALGIAAGDDRARALGHLAECGECRAHVVALAQVADDLLLLAPSAEPPAGFESRVLEQITPPQAARPRRRRWLVVAGAAAAAALATALLLLAVFADDHRLAGEHRDLLAASDDGRSFAIAPLKDASGASAGQVFAFEADPSWIFVTVSRDWPRGYVCEVVTRSGRRVRMGEFTGSWGGATPVPLRDIRAVEVLDRYGGARIVARLAAD